MALQAQTSSPQSSPSMDASVNRRWIPFHRNRPRTSLRLFCFPHAGGGASMYRRWQAGLPDEVEVCAVQLPGHETRISEPPLQSIDAVAEGAAKVLLSLSDVP